jgi:hypothetical protein
MRIELILLSLIFVFVAGIGASHICIVERDKKQKRHQTAGDVSGSKSPQKDFMFMGL